MVSENQENPRHNAIQARAFSFLLVDSCLTGVYTGNELLQGLVGIRDHGSTENPESVSSDSGSWEEKPKHHTAIVLPKTVLLSRIVCQIKISFECGFISKN